MASSSSGDKQKIPVRDLYGHRGKVTSVQWNKSGTKLASGSFDATVKVWAFDHGMFQSSLATNDIKAHNQGVDALCWSTVNDDVFATCSCDKTAKIWDLRGSGKRDEPVARVSTPGENINIAWSPCGYYVGVGNKEDRISFIDTRTNRLFKTVKFSFEVNEFTWAPSNNFLIVAGGQAGISGQTSGSIEIFKWPGNKSGGKIDLVRSVVAHTGSCLSLQVDKKTQRYLAVGAADGLASIWDLEELVCLRTMPRYMSSIRSVGFSHDGKYLAVAASDDGQVDVSEAETMGCVTVFNPPSTAITTVAWHPRSMVVAMGGEKMSHRGGSPGRDSSRSTDCPYLHYAILP